MQRWPSWVYGVGEEPDYRFSLANERTMLAWLRTALALLAGGVAVRALNLGLHSALETTISLVLISLGMALAALSWWRWASSERAMRLDRPLPSAGLGTLTAAGVLVVGVLVLLAFLT